MFKWTLPILAVAAFTPIVKIGSATERASTGMCDPQEPECFEVVVCQNELGCDGGSQLCARVQETGFPDRYCYQVPQ
jgi:hypothetical protein